MGFAPSGTGFAWNGVDDVGFYITHSNATVTGFTGGFRQGVSGPGSRNYATGYQAVSASGTACNEFSALYIRLTVDPSSGLIGDFTATPMSGPAPLTVNFMDQSFTSAAGGILTWAWDINNDGIDDYFTQNPSHIYTCPGAYSVKLTVTDGLHPPFTVTKNGFINVGNPTFQATTLGGGNGNLVITPVPAACFPTAVEGYTLVSFATTLGVFGNGPFLGLVPDGITILFINQPALPGHVIHFVVNGTGYPDGGAFAFPPGTFSSLVGLTADLVEVLLNSSRQLVLVSNVAQVTF
jgi:PKD repeat protein